MEGGGRLQDPAAVVAGDAGVVGDQAADTSRNATFCGNSFAAYFSWCMTCSVDFGRLLYAAETASHPPCL